MGEGREGGGRGGGEGREGRRRGGGGGEGGGGSRKERSWEGGSWGGLLGGGLLGGGLLGGEDCAGVAVGGSRGGSSHMFLPEVHLQATPPGTTRSYCRRSFGVETVGGLEVAAWQGRARLRWHCGALSSVSLPLGA